MKIGIITYWSSEDNYGQQLQMYALYTFLTNMGHDVSMINYAATSDSTLGVSFLSKIKKKILEPQTILQSLRHKLGRSLVSSKEDIKDCEFKKFRDKYFKWTKHYATYVELVANPPIVDAYICGSDMIWCESNKCRPYFIDFISDGCKIAYAPSFGRSSITKTYQKEVKRMLSSFSAISMREESGVEICKSLGYTDAKWMPDPTVLLNKAEYIKIEKQPEKKNGYVFMYLLGHTTEIPFSEIYKFAADKKLDVCYRASQRRSDEYPKVYPTIEEWIGYMNHAEYIITNSFHGCMIAIILNKRFIYLPLTGDCESKNARAYSILDKLSLNDRIWRGDLNAITHDIDYAVVNSTMKNWIEDADEYLSTSILQQ